ncbi:MAG TPA: hypothetical protein VMF12_19195 [Xanthobacteraceae bacterium]|nr:hypothetical protein [Xanthobacteraceae bacterium]
MRSAGNFHPEWGYLAPAPSFMRTARVALVATAIGATAGAVVVVSLVARPGANDDNSSIAAHALVSAAPLVTAPVVSASPPAGKAPATVTPAMTPPPAMAQAPAPPKTPAVAASTQLQQAPVVRASAQPQAPGSAPVPDDVAGASKTNLASVRKTSPDSPQATVPAHFASAADPTAPADVTAASPEPIAAPEASPAKKEEIKRRRPTSAEAWRRWQAENNAKKRPREASGFGPLLRLFSFRGPSFYEN